MQLDHTRIAVRERDLLDTFDLSLHVLRGYFGRLCFTFFVGAAPFFMINHFLLGWIIEPNGRDTFYYMDDAAMIGRFAWEMSVLVTIEAPLASIFATAFLGQAMFVDRPRLEQIGKDVLKMLPRLVWCQLLARGVLLAWLLMLSLDRHGDLDSTTEIVGLGGLFCFVLALRFWRPFINEIVLLERNPLVAAPGALTVGRRSKQLHEPSAGDLFFRGVATAALASCLTASVFGTFWFVSGVFLNTWKLGPFMIEIVFPLSMWIVAGYLTVVRFLGYLDLRIRHEGWEVELRFRAEGERLANRVA